MLNIKFKPTKKTILNVDAYFDYNYIDDWFKDKFVQQIVKDIDKSEVKSADCIVSPVLGQIAVTKLSSGTKALILMLKEPELEIWATACGDNCAEWIIRISEMHDLRIVLEHVMHFPRDFKGKCLDNGKHINNLDDYRDCIIQLM